MKRILILAAILCIFIAGSIAEDTADMILLPEDQTETIETVFPPKVDEAALVQDYFLSVMPHKSDGRLRASRPSGLSLTGPSRELYRLLAAEISIVAAGNESDTSFVFPAADVYHKTVYTAEDLGVSYIRDDSGFNPEAVKAMTTIRDGLNFQHVMTCLMNDFPLQMYWFGKECDVIKCTISGTTDRMKLTGTVTFKMRVAEDYAVQDAADDGTITYRAYEVDTSYGQAVQNAADNAAVILNRYAGLSGYALLKAYRDEIRSLTTYNSAAGQGNYQFTYGNPWQLVWVFDGDPGTTVVCEGFAKAFQYLVEEGTDTAEAISVQGYLDQVKLECAHMWNVVSIDGHNYLVDVTNDTGYRLFMVGGDGNAADGYSTAGHTYFYNRTYTYRTDEELTIEPYSYNEWKTATTTAPTVQISNSKVYPGYQTAVRVQSCNGILPAESAVIRTGVNEETVTLTDGIFLYGCEENTEISISAVIDGRTTPETGPIQITAADTPENTLRLPAGASVGFEAFSGIAAEFIQIHDNQVAAGSFDPDAVLAVDAAGDWFGSGYQFVVAAPAGEAGAE